MGYGGVAGRLCWTPVIFFVAGARPTDFFYLFVLPPFGKSAASRTTQNVRFLYDAQTRPLIAHLGIILTAHRFVVQKS
jgi:hypothetical protein